MTSRQLVRTPSGRLLWWTGISFIDPAAERLAASILLVCSSISLLSILAIVAMFIFGFFYGGSIFSSFLVPILGWSGIRCRSRCLLICFTIANGATVAVFVATTLPFLVQLAGQGAALRSVWFWLFSALSLLLVGLHLYGLVLGCKAASNAHFLEPLRQDLFTNVSPDDMLKFGAGRALGAPAPRRRLAAHSFHAAHPLDSPAPPQPKSRRASTSRRRAPSRRRTTLPPARASRRRRC